jgi:hypothetical protein
MIDDSDSFDWTTDEAAELAESLLSSLAETARSDLARIGDDPQSRFRYFQVLYDGLTALRTKMDHAYPQVHDEAEDDHLRLYGLARDKVMGDLVDVETSTSAVTLLLPDPAAAPFRCRLVDAFEHQVVMTGADTDPLTRLRRVRELIPSIGCVNGPEARDLAVYLRGIAHAADWHLTVVAEPEAANPRRRAKLDVIS